jgi:hypothetical protein
MYYVALFSYCLLSECLIHLCFRSRQLNFRYNVTAVSADYMFSINNTQCPYFEWASVKDMFAINGLLLAYIESCKNLIAVYAIKSNNMHVSILANFTMSQVLSHPRVNIALTPAGHVVILCRDGAYNHGEYTQILTYSGQLNFHSDSNLLPNRGRLGSTVNDDIVMCNKDGDIIKLTWCEHCPVWTTLFVGTQRSPWLCDRVLQVRLQDGDTAWWISEWYSEEILDDEGSVDINSSSRLAIYKQQHVNSHDVITLHYVVSMNTPITD